MAEADNLVREHVEEARSGFDRKVAATMAILAVLLAADALVSHRAHTEELLAQAKASDQWAYYQAKTIRKTTVESASELGRLMGAGAAADPALARFRDTAARYEHETKEIETQAREFERERDVFMARANRSDVAEIFLEIAIVACSLAILTKSRGIWLGSLLFAATGTAIAVTAIAIH